jgi:hypothetical protein
MTIEGTQAKTFSFFVGTKAANMYRIVFDPAQAKCARVVSCLSCFALHFHSLHEADTMQASSG